MKGRPPEDAPNARIATDARPIERVRARLGSLASDAAWRVVAAFAAALISVVATSGGLFFYAPEVQAAILGGMCAALIAPTRRSAVAVAAAATLVGIQIGPSNPWIAARTWDATLAAAVIAGLLAGLVALAVRAAAGRIPRPGTRLTWVVVAWIVANVWMTTIQVAMLPSRGSAGETYAPAFQSLSGAVVLIPADDSGDRYAYLQVLGAVKRGEPFYRTWRDQWGALVSPGASAGSSVVNYHLPLIFWFWAALPGTSVSVIYAYLALVSLAVAAVPLVVAGTVRAPLAISGSAAIASYLFIHGTTLNVLFGEPWAGALAVLALAAWTRSSVSVRWKAWTVAAVVLAVMAALVREPAVLIPVAGLGSALLVRDGQRRFRVSVWAAGLLVFVGAYVAHYVAARPFLSGPAIGAALRPTGLATIISAVTHRTPALGQSIALPLVLASAGLVGVWLLRDARTRVFASGAVLSTLLAFMLVNNGAMDAATGATVNYWGAVVVPMMYACMPTLFAFIPGMVPGARRGAPGRSTGDPSGRARAEKN